ncbi:MAG TPA: serine hydrolase domain-containing protein [Symbiobacteriaceae bacterium]|nr:serine hydrolase domain-containing protein [Symbiobacteriaceae bacterium]
MIPSNELLQKVDQFMQQELRRHQLPAAYAVVAGGEVLLDGSYDPAGGATPVTPDTPFEIGSITKSMTATAILQLRDKGLLDLDAPVRRYLPWFRLASAEASARITIRHLLTHTSGISRGAQGSVVAQDYDRIWPSAEAGVRALGSVKPASAAGSRFAYSNMGYAVLGMVVEAVSGRPWAQYIQEEIMAPLGMTRSMADYRTGPHAIATPHRWAFGRPVPVGHRLLGPYLAPAGSTTACSVTDLALYLAAHMGDRPLPGVTPESLTEAHSGVAAAAMAPNQCYGLGWVDQTNKNGERVIWHNGGTEGSSSIAMFAPAHGVGVVVLTSRFTQATDKLGAGMLGILRGKEAKPIRSGPDPFQMISLVVAGFALASAVLLVALARAVMIGTPAGWGHVLGFGLPAAALWYLTTVAMPKMGDLPISKIRRWPIDSILAVGGTLLATSLWTIYALYRSIVLPR